MEAKEVLQIIISLIGGGACGALLTEHLRRKRSRTQRIPLIERINRNPIKTEIKGIRFFRETGPNQLTEVKNIREYQMTLRNTSENDLRDAEVHFEFSGDAVEAWASKTKLGNISLRRVDADPSAQNRKAVRWQMSQFPSGDSVEFSFQVVEPTSEEYDVALYKTNNVVIEKSKDELPLSVELVLLRSTQWTSRLLTVMTVYFMVLATWLTVTEAGKDFLLKIYEVIRQVVDVH